MIFELTVSQFIKGLQNLDAILEKSAQFAESKKVDFPIFLESRLAIDQFPLVRQIQIACDTAKLGASRLTLKPAPEHQDKEKSLIEIRTRIQETINYLKTLKLEDYKEAAERKISQPRWEGQYLTGHDYVIHHVIPNFYFHLTTAYSILRHNGVEIGKKDYLGPMPFKR